MSTWLITGCSSGLGRALAREVLARGHDAVVTARNTAALQEFVDSYPDTALVVGLDVTDPAQVTAATERAEARFGGVEVLVNNAGYGYRAAVEEGDEDDVQRLFDTNFFGAVSMIKAVLPGMRARRTGAIVNISSIGARSTAVGSGYYAATKAALEGLSGSLQKEVRPLGISVTIVEPGGFRTEFAGRSLAQSAEALVDYAETAGKRRKENATGYGKEPGDPAKAARAIVTAVEAPDSPFLLLLGEDAYDRFQSVYQARGSDVEQWRELTLGTSYAE
ncbi:oxidoreductase [Rhodococcus xishaensis]|uniref:SDR family NAD(P)-dependent oxidoreductase n=1 Tax=Rhodococcus xishaensis TaxID=2487364 RepID=A0A438APK9_9NOCA|nr:oxidoreductase [Rhodococcus xishaensis]RVW00600.1 SDR family NAD(P)-dependent oxidoreductase [Rhodococcus xishaensis]